MPDLQITQDTTLEEINAHVFPAKRTIPNISFLIPPILISKENGQITIIPGGNLQLEHEIEESYSFEEVKDYPFEPLRYSPFNFMGRTLQVLDDKSKPTAQEYLEERDKGEMVLWQFQSVEVPFRSPQISFKLQKPVWHNRWLRIRLPK